jgi:hypothetical protein
MEGSRWLYANKILLCLMRYFNDDDDDDDDDDDNNNNNNNNNNILQKVLVSKYNMFIMGDNITATVYCNHRIDAVLMYSRALYQHAQFWKKNNTQTCDGVSA